MNGFNPLALSSSQFAHNMVDHFGKGYQQALALYKGFFRTGKVRRDLPEFANAPQLLKAMAEVMSVDVYPLSTVRNDQETVRFLLKTPEGYAIESVVISMQHGKTVCVSSQIGCRMGCRFCQTGKLGRIRNLSAAEIVLQVFVASHVLNMCVKNVVFMGMGEPFDNYDAVIQAVTVLQDMNGLGIGPRHISISTSGDIEGILRLSMEPFVKPNLTVSLNASNDALRAHLMPFRRKDSMASLRDAMATYYQQTGRTVYVSYVLLGGVNDHKDHALELAKYLSGLSTRVNIIPYNGVGETSRFANCDENTFHPPTPNAVACFLETLRSQHIRVFLRGEKGASIDAACGQLALGFF